MKVEIPDVVVEAIAERAAVIALERLAAQPSAQEFLTVKEAAELLRCKEARIYELCSSGALTRVKDGGRVLIRRVEIDAHLGLRDALAPARLRRIVG